MRRRLLFLVLALLAAVLVLRCDLFSVPPEDFHSDSTIGTARITIPWIAPWVASALDRSRAYLLISTVALELHDSDGDVIASATVNPEPDEQMGAGSTYVADWTVPVGEGYWLLVDITNANASPSPLLTGISQPFSVTSGGTTYVTVTCKPVAPTPLAEDVTTASTLAATGEQWFTATAAGTDTRFYCDTSAASGYIGTADIWVFDGVTGIYQDYAAGAETDMVHFDTTVGQVFYVGVYASTAATFGVRFASTTMDLTVSVDSVTYKAGKVTVDYSVTNTGVDTAESFQVDFSDGGSGRASKTHRSIAPGTISDSVKFSTSLTSGTISAEVDSLSEMDETDEDNNTDSLVWTAETGSTGISVQ